MPQRNISAKMQTITETQWAQIDSCILANTILRGVRTIIEATNVKLSVAMDIFYSRYEKLRSERPKDFACSNEEYWQGFQS
jgi:hypothetical protein